MPSIPKGSFPTNFSLTTSCPEETEAAGEQTGALLYKGGVLALSGPLGAGKTCFVKGIARSLRVSAEITSPSYTIVSEYEAEAGGEKLPFYHIDVYRLEGGEDFAAMGGEDYLGGGGIAVVEWSERIKNSLPEGTLFVEIEILDGGRRRIRFEGGGGRRGGE